MIITEKEKRNLIQSLVNIQRQVGEIVICNPNDYNADFAGNIMIDLGDLINTVNHAEIKTNTINDDQRKILEMYF